MTGRNGAARRWPVRLVADLRLFLLLPLLLWPATARAVVDMPDGRVQWNVWREGEKIGTHVMTVRHQVGDMIVENEIQILVRLLTIPVYRYVHRDQEIWRAGQLVGLTAFTNDNDEASSLELTAAGNALVVDGPVGRFYAPSTTVPSSLWHIDMTRSGTLLDVATGNLLAVHFSEGAEEPVALGAADVAARRISASGDLQRELWYGSDGLLVRQQFAAPDGTTLDFLLDRK